MKKIVVLAFVVVLLAGCGPTTRPTYYAEKPIVITVPKNLYVCPDVEQLKKQHLTERDVAHLLLRYKSVRDQCKASLDAIANYLQAAKRRIENKS